MELLLLKMAHGVIFFSTMGLFGTYFQCVLSSLECQKTRASQGQCLVYSFALSILGVLIILLDCWPVSGGRVQDRSEEPDFPDLCFTICSNVTWGERVGGTVLRSGRRELNGSVGCSEASRSVMVGVWMGVRRVRSGRMVMT